MGPGRFSESSNGLEVNEASGKIAVHLVKYWTLLLEILAIAAWICFYNVKPTQDEGRAQGPGPGMTVLCLATLPRLALAVGGGLSSLIIVTVIALDVLHPCAYLWVGETKMTPAKANSLSWYQAGAQRGPGAPQMADGCY